MPNDSNPDPLSTRKLTWAVLLARWVEFAQSALALPDNKQGQLMRRSVPDIITLQAVWFALGELDQLDASQRALGLDRAELLIDGHSRALIDRWQDAQLPDPLIELIDDARQRLTEATQ